MAIRAPYSDFEFNRNSSNIHAIPLLSLGTHTLGSLKESSMAAILKFKMAAGYHGNWDGYLALKNSPSAHANYTYANFHAFVKKVNDFRP